MSLPARRAAARIAWRQAARAPGRAVLIGTLIGLPIAALTVALVVGRTVQSSPELQADATMGSAQAVLFSRGTDPSVATSLLTYLPAGATVVGVAQASATVARAGSAITLDLVEPAVRFDAPPVAGMFTLLSGRVPQAAGEAAMPPGLLHALGGKVRGTVEVDGLRLRVTGLAADSQAFLANDIVVGPGTLGSGRLAATSVDYLIQLPPAGGPVALSSTPPTAPAHQGRIPAQLGVLQTRSAGIAVASRDARQLARLAFLAAALLLFGTGLIVAAALLIGSNRQLRGHGLMAAVGAERGDIRTVVLLGGTVLGAAGSLAGVAVGLAVAVLAHPELSRFTNRVVGPTIIRPAGLLAAVGMGTLAATVAAILPALAAGRVPPVQALAGRGPEPVAPGRVAMAGLGVLGAGSAGLAIGYSASRPVLIIGSMAAMAVGSLLAIPLMVALVGRLAGMLPTTARIATREMTRYGRRTGAAVAAATIALTMPLVASAEAASKSAQQAQHPAYRADIALYSGPTTSATQALAAFQRAFPGSTIAAMTDAQTVAAQSQSRQAAVNELFLGGPDLLQVLGAAQAIPALKAGDVVVLEGAAGPSPTTVWVDIPPGVPGGTDQAPPDGPQAGPGGRIVDVQPQPTALPASTVRLAGYGSALPQYVMALGAYQALLPPGVTLPTAGPTQARVPGDSGEQPVPQLQMYFLDTGAPLSSAELREARSIASAQGGTVSSDADYLVPDTDMAALWIGGALLALGIVAVAVALVAAESRRDYAIVVAVGAGPFARRKIVAARAASMALIAAAVAVPAGLLPYAIAQGSRHGGLPVVVPWAGLGAVVALVPLIAALGAALTSREPGAMALLRPVE